MKFKYHIVLLWVLMSCKALALDFGAAGVPRDLASQRDYETLFQTLEAQGVNLFIPTFQYQEVPEALSYGYEVDFMPPCTAEDPAFSALRDSNIRLLMPAELLYPAGVPVIDQAGSDPLQQLLACAGRDAIAGVISYDEAILNRIPLFVVRQLYQHVKRLFPDMPVVMVHAPLKDDLLGFERFWWRSVYRLFVKRYSQYADIIAFDVYPIPADVAQLASISGQSECTKTCLVADYAQWLQAQFPGQETWMVLQGFSYVNLYDADFLSELLPANEIGRILPPNRVELQNMLKAVEAADTETVIWWGQASLPMQSSQPWADIVELMLDRPF